MKNKNTAKISLLLTILGLIVSIFSINNKNIKEVNALGVSQPKSSDVYVSSSGNTTDIYPGSTYILSGSNNWKTLYVRSNNATYDIKLSNYSIVAPDTKSALNFQYPYGQQPTGKITLTFNIYVEGTNYLEADNHTPLMFYSTNTAELDITFHLYLVGEAELTLKHRSGNVKGISVNHYDSIGSWTTHFSVSPSCYVLDGVDTWQKLFSEATPAQSSVAIQTNHSMYSIVHNPTCTEAGYTAYYCNYCSYSYTVAGQGAHGHVYTTQDFDPTCTEAGYTKHTCTYCGHSYNTAGEPAHGHDYFDEVTDPTCTEQGYTTHSCTFCDDVYVDSYVEAHGHDYIHTVYQPTCTEEGYTLYICKICHDEYEDNIVDPAGHRYAISYEEGTCITKGRFVFVCKECGDTYYEEGNINPSKHLHVITDKGFAPTCTSLGKTDGSHCADCGAILVPQEDIPMLEHIPVLRNDSKPTLDKEGYTGDYYCSVCGVLLKTGEPIEKITADNVDEEIAKNIKADSEEEQKKIEEDLENISKDDLIEISDTTSKAYNALDDLLNSGEITPEEYEEKVEIVNQVTKEAVSVGAKISNAEEEGSLINEMLPEDSGIDMGGVLAEFYQNVFNDLLGNSTGGTTQTKTGVKSLFELLGLRSNGSIRHTDTSSTGGIDLDTSLDVYKRVGEFVDTIVSNMTEAALILRDCSGESLKQEVQLYIEKISVSSFRDFDPNAANMEFVANAKEAILLNLQQTVLASLEESYNKALEENKYSGNKLDQITEEYNAQVEAVSDLETFAIMIIEVMRLNYIKILDVKLDMGTIDKATYDVSMLVAKDVDSFAPIYDEIFESWALQKDNQYGISLEELSTATVEKEGHVNTTIVPVQVLSKTELLIITVLGSVTLLSAILYFILNKKGVKVYE